MPWRLGIGARNPTPPVPEVSGTTSLYAGQPGVYGTTDGDRLTTAEFGTNQYICYSAFDDSFWISSWDNDRTRNIASDGTVEERIAGQGFLGPWGIQVDSAGLVFACQAIAQRVYKYTTGVGVVSHAGSTIGFSDGTGGGAKFSGPRGMTMDHSNGDMYLADNGNGRIRKVTSARVVTTVVSSFASPVDVVLDPSDGTSLYAISQNAIYKIVAGTATIYAGGTAGYVDDNGTAAKFDTPTGLTCDSDGVVWVADTLNHMIRRIGTDQEVTTWAGSTQGYAEGVGGAAQFDTPFSICVGGDGALYVVDQGNNVIRRVVP